MTDTNPNTDTDSDDDGPRHDSEFVDLGPTETIEDKYGKTSEGTADPNKIRNPEIRDAVEQARERKRAANADADTGPEPEPEPEPDSEPEPATADPPRLEDEPRDPDEFFEDELGDPRREHNEARAAGLHSDTDSDTDTETPTMTDTNDDTDLDPNRHRATDDHDDSAYADDPHADDPHIGDTHIHSEAAADAANARGEQDAAQQSAEQVEPLSDAERADVDAAVGADADADADADDTPDIEDIDFEAQDIESASEDRGDQLIEFNDCYFVLTDVDDTRAENLMNALQDEALDPQDRFDVIIDTIVKKPEAAAARTAGWKYLHRATLAGRCMEHCGLDDIVDFRPESDDTRGRQRAE